MSKIFNHLISSANAISDHKQMISSHEDTMINLLLNSTEELHVFYKNTILDILKEVPIKIDSYSYTAGINFAPVHSYRFDIPKNKQHLFSNFSNLMGTKHYEAINAVRKIQFENIIFSVHPTYIYICPNQIQSLSDMCSFIKAHGWKIDFTRLNQIIQNTKILHQMINDAVKVIEDFSK